MEKKPFVLVAIITMLTLAVFPMMTVSSSSTTLGPIDIAYYPDPVRAECWDAEECDLPPGTVPFNVDMVDAEELCETGDGVYVAVLDTGLLSNYLYFFPEGTVDIKEEWGIGFTHDVWYDPLGDGNWSIQYKGSTEYRFSYGSLRDDRGFITHDNGAPDKYGFGWGSGHGTHVTSTITGWQLVRPDQSFWVRGVAPKVTIIPVLVLDDWIEFADDGNGWFWRGGTDEMVAAGIRYVGDLAKKYKVKIVINMSLGGSEPTDIIEDAINYAICRGVIVVASAGNNGYDGMGWPGAYPQVISVAAAGWTQEYIDYNHAPPANPMDYYWWIKDVPENLWTTDPLGNEFQAYLTDFSARPNPELGQEIWHLDVSAPGAGVKGPYKGYGSGQWSYSSVWGTSQAAPHVAGIAALILQRYPKVNQFSMELCLKIAGFANRLTKLCEEERTAIIFDIFSWPTYPPWLLAQTWLWKDYGTGLLQADEALWLAKLMFGPWHKFVKNPCHY